MSGEMAQDGEGLAAGYGAGFGGVRVRGAVHRRSQYIGTARSALGTHPCPAEEVWSELEEIGDLTA
jgi:hypothetical protein